MGKFFIIKYLELILLAVYYKFTTVYTSALSNALLCCTSNATNNLRFVTLFWRLKLLKVSLVTVRVSKKVHLRSHLMMMYTIRSTLLPSVIKSTAMVIKLFDKRLNLTIFFRASSIRWSCDEVQSRPLTTSQSFITAAPPMPSPHICWLLAVRLHFIFISDSKVVINCGDHTHFYYYFLCLFLMIAVFSSLPSVTSFKRGSREGWWC